MDDSFKLIKEKLKLTPKQTQNKIDLVLKVISQKYPFGLDNNFFTFPGFESIKNHNYPIIYFNEDLNSWEIKLESQFILEINTKEN